jgi:fructokinase
LSDSAPIVALGELLWDKLPSGKRAGGAPFNFAFHCNQLGHPAIIVSRVGDDELGRELRDHVRRLGVNEEFIQTDREHSTGTVEVSLDASGQPTYNIIENVAWDFIEWQPHLAELAETAQAVCFGTLGQRSKQSRETIAGFIAATNKTCLTVCDMTLRQTFFTNETILNSLRAIDWLKVNEEEAERVIQSFRKDATTRSGSDPVYWQQNLLPAIHSEIPLLIVTRGSSGCVVANLDERIDLPGIHVKVADTVGAGDAFTAAFLTQSLEGKPLRECARFANAYAAVVASKPGGTPTVTRAEAEALL